MKQTSPCFFVFFRRALALCGAALLLFSGCGANPGKASAGSGLYAASLSEAEVFIDLPTLRQYGDYTCGATCVQMLMNALFPYEGDRNLTGYEEALGTTPEAGTPPEAITHFFEDTGVAFTATQNLTLSDLKAALSTGHPVLLPLQAWSADGSYNVDDPSDPETYLAEGHWVICVGYADAARPYFIFNDPACVGHTLIAADEFDRRWIDQSGDGTVYDHYGITITQPIPYDPQGLFYME